MNFHCPCWPLPFLLRSNHQASRFLSSRSKMSNLGPNFRGAIAAWATGICLQHSCHWLAWLLWAKLEQDLGQEESLSLFLWPWQHQAWQALTYSYWENEQEGRCEIWKRHKSESSLFFFSQQFVLQKPGWRGSQTLWDGNSHHFTGPSGGDGGEGGRELRFLVGQFLACPGVFGNHLLLKKRNK